MGKEETIGPRSGKPVKVADPYVHFPITMEAV
jgi:hypothetical protein